MHENRKIGTAWFCRGFAPPPPVGRLPRAAPGSANQVGVFLATMLVASSMIGSGIFLLPATLAGFGSMTALGWLIAAAGALIIGRVLGGLGRERAETGGVCAYVGRCLGPGLGFQATAVYWMACWTGNVAIALAAAGYLASLLPDAWSRPWLLALLALAWTWLLVAAQRLGPRRVCQLESASLFVGLIPIALVIALGWHAFQASIFWQSWNVTRQPLLHALPPSLVLMFWAFVGVESASVATAVVRDPERNVARATYGGVILAAVVYIAACSLLMGMLPAAALAHSTAPFADAIALVLGRGVGALVAVLALVKAVGSLAGWILLTTQTGDGGVEHRVLPAWLGGRSGLLWAGGLMSVGLLATVSPSLGQQFGEVIGVSVILTMLLYVYGCLAALRKDPWFAGLGLAFCIAVIAWSGAQMLLWTAGVVAATQILLAFRPASTVHVSADASEV